MSGIRVELQLSDGSFTSGILRANQTLAGFRKELARVDPHFKKLTESGQGFVTAMHRADRPSRTLLGTMRDLSIVAGAATLAFRSLTGSGSNLVGQIVKVNADIERLRFQMEGLSTAADPVREAAEAVRYLREQAANMPFSLSEISTSFVKFRAASLDAKVALEAVTDGIAAFGGTDEQLHRVTLGISQMSGKSVIQMEEMRQQLSEAMPSAMQTMARSMGVSIRELTEAISTGRVQSKPALEGFFRELELAYGGTAQRMMGTFSGQVTQLKANLQQLATGEGLSRFVNVTLKNLVRELNTFLQSRDAKAFADALGRGMSDVANRMGGAIRTAYQFRQELELIGKAALGLVALNVGVALLGRMNIALQSGRGAWTGWSAAMTKAMADFRLGVAGLVTGQHAMTAIKVGAMGAWGAVRGLALGLLTVAPYAVALGIAVSVLAKKFDLMGTAAREAYEEIREFGAKSRAEAERIVADQQQSLKDRASLLAQQLAAETKGPAGRQFFTPRGQELKEELDAVRAELAAVNGERARILQASAENERQTVQRQLDAQIQDRRSAAQRARNETIRDAEEERDARIAAAEETGEALRVINEDFQEKKRAADEKLVRDEIDMLRRMREQAVNSIAAATDPSSAESLRLLLDEIDERLDAADERAQTLLAGKPGIEIGPDIESNQDKIDRGNRALQGLRETVQGLQADIAGGSSEAAKMAARIEAGLFGDLEETLNPEVLQATFDELMELSRLEDALRQQLASQGLLDNLTADAARLKTELQGGVGLLAEVEARLQSGEFGNLAELSDDAAEVVENIRAAALEVEKLQKELAGKKLLDGLKGDVKSLVAQIGGATGKVEDLAARFASGEFGDAALLGDAFVTMREEALATVGVIEELERVLSGTNELRSMAEEAEGLHQRFLGAETAAAKMQLRIARGDFGTIEKGGEAVRRLHEALMQSARSIDLMNRMVDGRNALATLNEDVEGLMMGLRGASGAVAEMQYRINRGDFGSIETGGDAVRDLTDALMEAARQKEILDYLMKGKADLDGDIERARIRALEEQLELEAKLNGQELTDSQRIKARRDAGLYDGYGTADKIRGELRTLMGDIDAQAERVGNLGKKMRDDAFSAETVRRIDTVTDAINRMAREVGGLNGLLDGTDFAGFDPAGIAATRQVSGRQAAQERRLTEGGQGTAVELATGPARPYAPNQQVVDIATAALEAVIGPGGKVVITSGQEGPDLPQYGSRRHKTGNAADLYFLDAKGEVISIDDPRMRQIAVEAAGLGARGFGAGHEYMGNRTIHLDTVTDPSRGEGFVWGGVGKQIGDDFVAAVRRYETEGPALPRLAEADRPRPLDTEQIVNDQLAEQARQDVDLAEIEAQEARNQLLNSNLLRQNALTDLTAQISAISNDAGENARNENRIIEAILNGDFGPGASRDPNAPEYADLIAQAQELDRRVKAQADARERLNNLERSGKELAEERIQLDLQLTDANARIVNPDFVGESNALRQLNEALAERGRLIEAQYGRNSPEYAGFEADAADMVRRQRQVDAAERQAEMEARNRELREGLLTQNQLRRLQLSRDLARVDELAQAMREAGAEEIEITRFVEESKAAIRDAAALQGNAFSQQMRDWSDLFGKADQKAAQWTRSISSGIATKLTTGEGWSDALEGIGRDMVSTGVDFVMAQGWNWLSSSFLGQGTRSIGAKAMQSAAGAKTGGKTGGKGMMSTDLYHTGGIVGRGGSGRRWVSPGLWDNASRFHTGGVVGKELRRGERPIIAQDGEGVFTKEQMKAMGGGMGGISINAPVTVNANGGTPEQNADLAQQTARTMEQSLRNVVRDELARAKRPGGMMR